MTRIEGLSSYRGSLIATATVPNGTGFSNEIGILSPDGQFTSTRSIGTRFGAGCTDSLNRLPRIGSKGIARIGSPIEITLSAGPPGPFLAWLTGGAPVIQPLSPWGGVGCSLYTDLLVSKLVSGQAGRARCAEQIPGNLSLVGQRMNLQWVILDANLPHALPFALSQRLEVTIGR